MQDPNTNQSVFRESLQWHKEYEWLYKYRYARLVLLSPGWISDAQVTISDQEVRAWLKKTYSDIFNQTTLEDDVTKSDHPEKEYLVCRQLENLVQSTEMRNFCP